MLAHASRKNLITDGRTDGAMLPSPPARQLLVLAHPFQPIFLVLASLSP